MLRCLALGIGIIAASHVAAQDYPTRLIRIVTGAPGGPSDFAVRVVANGIAAAFGEQVIVDNRRGSVAISSQIVAAAPPDGYTLTFRGNTFWVFPLIEKTTYDPVADFAPISLATRQPSVLVVHPSLPVWSIRDLIALAKTRPGQLNYATAQLGSLSHLSAELFNSMAHITIRGVPYSGTQGALNDLIAGEVQMMIATTQAVMPHMQSGRLRGLAVTSAHPSPFAPGMPTIAASGLPGYEAELLQGIFAPAKTPIAIINRLNHEIVRLLASPDTKEKLFNAGVEASSSSPSELEAMMKSEMARLAVVVRETGLQIN
jgi:tripartite-type tricarboxylate transporter receptor subunit TctC